jgi:hypothetical protein
MGLAIAVTVNLTQFSCGQCGGTYAINERYREYKAEKSGYWHCPYCQCSWGYGKGELQTLREQVVDEQRRHQATLSRLNEAQSEKEKAEKKLRRVNKGICPECNRNFSNLARHMACKHKAK